MTVVDLDSILGRVPVAAASTARSVAVEADALVEQSAVEATGTATRIVESAGSRPAYAAGFLALAAFGGIVALRYAFAGAVS